MRHGYGTVPFERYADDILVHCRSKRQAIWLKTTIERRLNQCKLSLNAKKTKIVYCKRSSRKNVYPQVKFDFLGYTFRPRLAINREGECFVNFSPAISDKASKSIRGVMRGWHVHRMSDKSIYDISHIFNQTLRGWINYYGQYYKSALCPVFNQLNLALRKWAMRKYKKLRRRRRKADHWLGKIAQQKPFLFAHWQLGVKPSAGR